MRTRILFSVIIAVLILSLCSGTAQVRSGKRQALPGAEAKTDWLDGPVQFLITEEERHVYDRLTSEAEREQFIEDFWKRRDSNPETAANEFREDFFTRVAYANQQFTAGAPGWRTDRGRIYILYGPPNRRDAHPMGGRYEKPPSQGGDTITTYPFEIWEYDFIAGIGSDITIEFVDRSHTGLYVLETDPNRKDVFYWRRGEMPRQRAFLRFKETPFERLRVWAKFQAPPPLQFPKLREEVRAAVSFNALPFEAGSGFVRISTDLYAVPITVSVANDKLLYSGKDGFYESELQLYGSVANLNGALVYQFDEAFQSRSDNIPFADLAKRRTFHQRIVPLPPGRYKIRLALKDAGSGKLGVQDRTIWIPHPSETGLNTSSLIYADVLQPASEHSRGEEFTLGPMKVVPNIRGAFQRRHRLGLYLEVYDLELDSSTKSPSFKVVYLLESADGTRIPIGQEHESRFVEGRTVVISKAIPLESLAPGKYRVRVQISDLLAQRACTLEGQVEVL